MRPADRSTPPDARNKKCTICSNPIHARRPTRPPTSRGTTASGGFFSLGDGVGPGQPNRRQDLIKIETILGNTGDLDIAKSGGPLGWWGQRQHDGILSYQRRNGLEADGTLLPGGPTITAMRGEVGDLLAGHTPPTPDEVNSHFDRLAADEPPLLNIRPARVSFGDDGTPPADDFVQVLNRKGAEALANYSHDGDFPGIVADGIRSGGPDAVAEARDLIGQVAEVDGRDRADRLAHGILSRLPADQQSRFLGTQSPAPRPLGVRLADLPDDSARPLFMSSFAGEGEGGEPPATPQPAPAPGGDQPEAGPAPDGSQQVAQVQAIPLVLGGLATAAGAGEYLRQQIEGRGQEATLPNTPPASPSADTPPLTFPDMFGLDREELPPSPVEDSGLYDYRRLLPEEQRNHDTGDGPHPDTQVGLDLIQDDATKQAVRDIMLGSGTTTAANDKGTNVDTEGGGFEAAKQQMGELLDKAGLDKGKITSAVMPGGRGDMQVYKGDNIKIGARPWSKKDARPTLEVQIPNGEDYYKIKRRY
jgi:hypothetical protein